MEILSVRLTGMSKLKHLFVSITHSFGNFELYPTPKRLNRVFDEGRKHMPSDEMQIKYSSLRTNIKD